jgi:hypothetical protein
LQKKIETLINIKALKNENHKMDNAYQKRWESKSALRTTPRKPIDFNISGDFFPQEKQVLFLLPEISCLAEEKKKEILTLSFYNYLQEIIHLESRWVCSACNKIINASLEITFDDEMKLNALTIMMDEYYHLYIAYDYMQQLKNQYTNISQFNLFFSDSTHAMLTIKERLDEPYKDIFEIIAVCIFETTLIKDLMDFFDTPDIHPAVTHYIKDHMSDEARHHVYFIGLIEFVWSSIPEDYRHHIGYHLGDFVTLYLSIEGQKRFNKQILSWVLGENEQSLELIEKIYLGFEITPETPLVKNVMAMLEKTNVLAHDTVQYSFRKSKLIA